MGLDLPGGLNWANDKLMLMLVIGHGLAAVCNHISASGLYLWPLIIKFTYKFDSI